MEILFDSIFVFSIGTLEQGKCDYVHLNFSFDGFSTSKKIGANSVKQKIYPNFSCNGIFLISSIQIYGGYHRRSNDRNLEQPICISDFKGKMGDHFVFVL